MSKRVIIGRSTKLFAAKSEGDRVWPEATTLTVGADVAAAATSITIALDPAITRAIPASTTRPVFLNFIELSGNSHLVKVTAPIAVGATSITVAALNAAIKEDAIAIFPVLLSNDRESANLSDDKTMADILTFGNEGYKDGITTLQARTISAPGFYSPLDAGYNTAIQAASSLDYDEIYIKLVLPTPKGYTTGTSYEFFTGVMAPLDIPATDIMRSELTFASRGVIRETLFA